MDAAEVRAELIGERAAAEVQLGELAADVADLVRSADGSNGDDEHDPEGATIAFERAQTQALQGAARRRIAQIDAALERLAAGRYGECVACGRAITPERLVARPSATRCVTCAGQARPGALRPDGAGPVRPQRRRARGPRTRPGP